MSRVVALLLLALFGPISSSSNSSVPNVEERLILMELFNSTNGEYWTYKGGWGKGDQCADNWKGIKCNDEGEVTEIKLVRNNQTGSLPDSLGGLSSLTKLDLRYGGITGPLPPSLADLVELTQISVTDHSITGPIPPLDKLLKLTLIQLNDNHISGPFPPALGNLTSLEYVEMQQNRISGTIPALDNLTSLYYFDVSYNEIEGPCPSAQNFAPEWGGVFCVKRNRLTGRIPAFTNLPEIQEINLEFNSLSGPIPPLEGLGKLVTLSMSNNNLTGPLPDLMEAPALEFAYFNFNELSGPINAFQHDSLKSFYIDHNAFSGPLPDFDQVPVLGDLCVNNNQLSGPIPKFPPSLFEFNGYNNSFSGALPDLGYIEELERINLSFNSLSGPLPSFASIGPRIYRINLKHNFFEGDIPSSVSTLTGLQQLDLSSNKLGGVIPNLSSLTELQELYLSDNEFQGPLDWLANLTSCTTITVNNNLLVGPLPRSIGTMTKLNMFVAHNNDLHGSLPDDLFELPNLQGVVLSGNPKLYGMLPTTLSSPSLTGVVMEGCDIVGYLPKKIESNLTTLYLAGNKIKSRGSNSIPRLPSTIQHVSLANNLLTGSISDDFFEGLTNLISFDIRHNNVGGEFNVSVFTMSILVICSTIVVPSFLVLMGDQRCLKQYKWPHFGVINPEAPHETKLEYTFCGIYSDEGHELCTIPTFSDLFKTISFTTTFNYPFDLSEQCFSAVVETYSPVVLESLIISDILQPSCWWLCREYRSEGAKWLMLAVGLFNAVLVPQIASFYATNINGGVNGLPLVSAVGGVAIILFEVGVGLLLKKLARGEGEGREEEGGEEGEGGGERGLFPPIDYNPRTYVFPPIDFLLDTLGLNFDEDMMLGDKWVRWWLFVDCKRGVGKLGLDS
ncbi:hypothetical protein TrCOL_g4603 [Triparma columacea]|uniref:Uncharacterized protein n=1 Tax=Triparma columacea TaxID=722753 RepID=A0A9W7FZP0_9STRA|nr:hypothetical protein TrCOL_g4603 [Triparma columacea]